MLEFKKISKPILEIGLIEKETNNQRFNCLNLTKYFNKWDNKDNYYYGLYDNNKLVCISFIEENKLNLKEKYIAEIQTVYTGKKYGKILLDNIIDNTKNVYLLCNPEYGYKLKQYYIENFNLNVFEIRKNLSIFNLNTVFFYKCEQKNINVFHKHFHTYKKDFAKYIV